MAAGDRERTSVEIEIINDEGERETVVYRQPTDGNVPGLIGERSYRCVICGFAYKKRDIIMFRGKPYGKPCGCYKDIKSIMMKEHWDRNRYKARNEEVPSEEL